MSEGQCGNCDHYQYIKHGKIECLVDGKLHDTGDSCDDYKTRIPSKSITVRSEEALEVKRSKKAKEAEQRQREFAEKTAEKGMQHEKELQQMRMKFDKRLWRASWWWQLILIVVSAGLGVIVTLVVQALTN